MKWFPSMVIIPLLFCTPAFTQDFVRSRYQKSEAQPAETYLSMTHDGAWCWFSDPRAVYFEGIHKRTYSGWIDASGNIHVGYYDHNTDEIDSRVIEDSLPADDHNNPSLLIGPEGRLYLFFTLHGGPHPIRFTHTVRPEDISEWTETRLLQLNDTLFYPDMVNTYTYTNPVMLSGEDNRIYLFWRGMDNKPNFSWSDDLGKSWTRGRIMIMPERIYAMRRPYLKVYSQGKNRIHFAFTDGHPRKEPANSIYYMQYFDGAFRTVTGEVIKKLEEAHVHPAEADQVYDASENEHKAWIWDIAEDEKGYPVLVYARFPDDSTHIYSYARWKGKKWKNHDLVNSGRWFPQTPDGIEEPEPNYSGGIVLDHEDPNIVYLSRNINGNFEIERWSTRNKGKSWRIETITANSGKDNVRPFAVRNADASNDLQLLWMMNMRYEHYYQNYHSSIKTNLKDPGNDNELETGY